MKSARSERDLCKTRLSNARVAKGAENGACGSPVKQFQNLPGMTEPCRTRVDCYTDSPPVRKLWGGILPRSDTSAFPREASGGFTRCCYLSHCVGRGGARLWRFCRYLSHYVGRGEEHGFCVFVDNCRIVSVEGVRGFGVLSITVALCRSRGRARLLRFVDNCRIVSVKGGSEALVFLSITVVLCRSRGESAALAFCRYLSYCVGRG